MTTLSEIKDEIQQLEQRLELLQAVYDKNYAKAVVEQKELKALLTPRQAAIVFGKNARTMANLFSKNFRNKRIDNSDGKSCLPYGVLLEYYSDTYARQTVTPVIRRAVIAMVEGSNMQQQEVADKLEISRATITRIMREHRAPAKVH